MRRLLAAVVVVALAGTGCRLQTAGAPKGGLTLVTVFDDAQHLVEGHAVRVADVQVGTVTKVALQGYRARVTMSIAGGRRIPQGTTAVLAQTSILGENYVRLVFPEHFDPRAGPFLADRSEIAATGTEPQLELVTSRAITVLAALSTGDLSRLVNATAEALGGRGQTLHGLIEQLAQVGNVYASQAKDLAGVIDGLGKLGSTLAAGAPDLGALLDHLSAATTTLAAQREKVVGAVRQLTELARALNDKVLLAHAQQLETLLAQLRPVLGTITADKATLNELITNVKSFVINLHKTAYDGALLFYVWFSTLVMPNGQQVPTAP